MRPLVICGCLALCALAEGQPASEPPLVLHDPPPQFRKGQFETSTDAGAHASVGIAARSAVPQSSGLESQLRQAQSAESQSFEANLALGQHLRESGNFTEASRFLELARELLRKEAPSPRTTHLEARWLAASGKPVLAAERFQQAAEADPTEEHLFDWGNHMLAHGAAGPAGKIFAYAVGTFPRSARLKVAQGVSYYAQGNYDGAIKAVREGIALDPKDLRPLVFLGQMIGVAPQLERDVQRELERFATLYPEHAQAQYFHGLSLATLKENKAAERYLRRAATLDPQMPEPRFEIGKLLAESGRTAEAIRELEAAVRLSPKLSPAHYKLGQLYQSAGQAKLANQHFAAYRKARADQTAREEQERQQRLRLAEKQ